MVSIVVPILQVKKLRHREVKQLVWGNTAKKRSTETKTQAAWFQQCELLTHSYLAWKGVQDSKHVHFCF